MALLDELLVGLGFDYDSKDLNQFKQDVAKTTNVAKEFIKVAAAGAAAITAFTMASTKASDEQGKLSDEIGESVKSIDALQFALIRSGGSADGMVSSLRDLSIRASEAARGVGSGVEAFGILGISATDSNGELKSTSDLILEVSQRMQGLNRSRQLELADKLGLRDSIRLLQQGPEAIRELLIEADQLGVTTAEDAKIAADYQDAMTNIWQVMKQMSRVISRELAPITKDLADTFLDWWKTNKDIIEQNLPKWIDGATVAIKMLAIATGVWISMRLATHVITLISLFKGLSVATLAASAGAAIIPALVAGSIAAMVLLAEDAKTFFDGGESFIGDMIEKFPEWTDQLHAVASVMATLADLTLMIFDGWSQIINMFKNFSLEGFLEAHKNSLGFLGDITGVYTVEGESFIPGLPQFMEGAKQSAQTIVDKVEIFVDGAQDSAETIGEKVFQLFNRTSQELNSPVDQ